MSGLEHADGGAPHPQVHPTKLEGDTNECTSPLLGAHTNGETGKEAVVEPLLQPLLQLTAEPSEQRLESLGELEERRRFPSLAQTLIMMTPKRGSSEASSSSWMIKLLLPVLMLSCHALFLFGQTAPMWHIHVSRNYNVWVNATSQQAKLTFDTLGFQRAQHVVANDSEIVETFTFWYSIHELWTDTPGCQRFAQFTAILLLLCSGIWPHIKLLGLQVAYWYSPAKVGRLPLAPQKSLSSRRKSLQFLATAGKWSLVDVFTVCLFYAILQFRWIIDPVAFKTGFSDQMSWILQLIQKAYSVPHLCGNLLGYRCLNPKKFEHVTKCRACETLINEAFTHPEWSKQTGQSILHGIETSGGGQVHLTVQGDSGIYAFCVAVVLSIGLSLVMDFLERRAQAMAYEEHQGVVSSLPDHERSASADSGDNDDDEEQFLLSAVEVTNNDDDSHRESLNNPTTPPMPYIYTEAISRARSWKHHILPLLTLVMVLLSIFLPIATRQVEGAIPIMIRDVLGVSWKHPYSLWTLTTSLDWRLLIAFGLFVIVGPVLRCILCLVRSYPVAVEAMGAFCAWEVFIVALVEISILLPKITDGLLWLPQCRALANQCLTVKLDIMPVTFVLVILTGFLLVITSELVVRTRRFFR